MKDTNIHLEIDILRAQTNICSTHDVNRQQFVLHGICFSSPTSMIPPATLITFPARHKGFIFGSFRQRPFESAAALPFKATRHCKPAFDPWLQGNLRTSTNLKQTHSHWNLISQQTLHPPIKCWHKLRKVGQAMFSVFFFFKNNLYLCSWSDQV